MFERLKSNLLSIPGWHTRRKIIVFESDDWGSIRIPSRETYEYLYDKGYPIDNSPYAKDCLESNDDISALIDVLSSSKNVQGQRPIFTLNNVVANPDFIKIREFGFNDYYFEPFRLTYDKYNNHDQSFKLLKSGVLSGIFVPQLHGREHLNFYAWIQLLRLKDPIILDMFNHNISSLPNLTYKDGHYNFQRAFDHRDEIDKQSSCRVLVDACQIFNNTWGFKPLSFIAPNFFWDDEIEKCLANEGIRYLQGQRAQCITDMKGSYSVRFHYIGQRNSLNQLYLIRNCYFEPSFDSSQDYVNLCLNNINDAFRMHKPAIISTHRVNYMGEIDVKNRDNGLRGLRRLLTEIHKKWPEAEYMSTNELGDYILKSTKKSD